MLFHNRNLFGAIPIGHSIYLKKKHEHIKVVLDLLKYDDHKWVRCVDLKMAIFLLGQQGRYTKYPCFLCLWDSRAETLASKKTFGCWGEEYHTPTTC